MFMCTYYVCIMYVAQWVVSLLYSLAQKEWTLALNE